MMATPFQAVLLGCSNGHYEATTLDAYTPEYGRSTCQACERRLHLLKTVTIYPANHQPAAKAG